MSPDVTESVDPTETKQYVGRYRILTPIGVGSSATVYRGIDEASETEVAVKVLADNYSLVPEIRQRFLDEIALLMSIRSPAVAQVFGHGETESGQPYIVLELADRGTLGQRVDQLRYSGAAPNRQDLAAMADHLTEALASLHRAGIVHRDVSPGNILIRELLPDDASLQPLPSVQAGLVLSSDERYLLADLGFAKDLQHASGLTAGGGTRGFAAPEQRDEVTVVDHRADIFGATSVIEWMAEDSELIDEIEPFLQVGLADDPEDRYQSMEDWRKALHRSLDRRPPAVPAASFAASTKKPASDRTVGGWAKIAAVTVGVVLAAAAAVGFVATRSNDSDDALGSSALEGNGSSDPDGPVASEDIDSSADETDAENPTDTEAEPQTSSTTAPDTAATTTGSVGNGGSSATGATTQTTTTAAPQTSLTTAETPSPTAGTATTQSTAAPTQPTTETTQSTTATTRQTSSTAAPQTTATTVAATTTTADPRFEFSPRAYIQSPAAEATVSGDLRIRGTAEYREGITGVALIVRRLSDDYVWSPSSQSFTALWAQIPVAVTPSGADEVTWTYTVDEAALEPGRYLIRVWARGTDANDPLSDRREIVIPG